MTFKPIKIFASLFFLIGSAGANSSLKVVVTLPEFVEVVRDVSQGRVQVESLLSGFEDPHFVDAVPAYITKVRSADVVCFVGLDLEVGWLPKVLKKSSNPKAQVSGLDACDLSREVAVLEKSSTQTNRSMGDVHAHGNPHYYLSPTALTSSAHEVSRVLSKLDPAGAEIYKNGAKLFGLKMAKIKDEVKTSLKPVLQKTFLQFHKEYTYFFNDYGLSLVGAIEEKPGVPPSSARLAHVAQQAKSMNVFKSIGSNHSSERHLNRLQELSGVPFVRVPSGVNLKNSKFDSIEKLQKFLASEIIK